MLAPAVQGTSSNQAHIAAPTSNNHWRPGYMCEVVWQYSTRTEVQMATMLQ
jgi:hypothetical protein